ncbi:TonB-dependent receptor domain-containing protein [Halocynthiibacter styelae]|uniref:TonB-dependent receptor n=1 Tax=Halocynthiibacter styelae TaxID=2761955 RepID=A0A8J7J779_9RHOB|nr:TonB-dependent receptor [Paenihalocynthiibacter styelae]MBI1494655.1 TonB-dependent receptor [Paenihalocynthiibacter styelae]
MHGHASQKRRLLATTTLAGLMVATLAAPVMAQETPEEPGFFTMLGRLVFGAGSERVAIDVPQSVTVLNEEDIEEAELGTIGDVLQRAPGVTTVGSESPFGESLNIRGIGSGTSSDEPKIIVNIDGVGKYYEQYRMGSLFTDPGFFKSVEVLRGPSSSTLYGSGAIAGVIALETKDAADFLEGDDDFAIRQRLQYGSNGGQAESSTFFAYSPDERLDVLLGVFINETDASENGDGEELLGTDVSERNYMLKGSYRFGTDLEHTVEAAYIYYDGFGDDIVYDTIDNSTFWGTIDRDVEDTTAYVSYNYNPAGNNLIDLDVQLSYADSFVGMTDVNLFSPAFDVDYAYEETGLKIENRSEWSGASFENYLTTGLSYSVQDRVVVRSAGVSSFHPAGETTMLSAYAQNEMVFNDRLTLIGGLRLDHQDTAPHADLTTGEETSNTGYAGTIAAHYKVNDRFAVFGSASYTERLPVVDELYDTRATSGGANQAAVGSLDTEVSRNFELGASWQFNDAIVGGDELALKGVIFRNNMTDQIVRNNDGVAGEATYVNIAESHIQGLELEASWASETWFGSLAYTYLDGEELDLDTGSMVRIDDLPADTLALGLGWRAPETNVELGWDMTAAKREGDTGGYAVHDVYVKWSPESGVLEDTAFRFGISNIFDRNYRSNQQSTAVSNEGRSFNLSLTKTF